MTALYAETSQAIAQARHDELVRVVNARARRHLLRLLDWAIRVCEEANLERRQTKAPDLGVVLALVEQVQAVADERIRRPKTNQEALDQLFRLQELYLLAGDDAAEAGEEEADGRP